jgi:homogentisate 1,2-dioxygenase
LTFKFDLRQFSPLTFKYDKPEIIFETCHSNDILMFTLFLIFENGK